MSTFESIQAITHIATSLRDVKLLNIINMVFAQIKFTFPRYTKDQAMQYFAPLTKLEMSFNIANAVIVPVD
jgi:hypothetical protein